MLCTSTQLQRTSHCTVQPLSLTIHNLVESTYKKSSSYPGRNPMLCTFLDVKHLLALHHLPGKRYYGHGLNSEPHRPNPYRKYHRSHWKKEESRQELSSCNTETHSSFGQHTVSTQPVQSPKSGGVPISQHSQKPNNHNLHSQEPQLAQPNQPKTAN